MYKIFLRKPRKSTIIFYFLISFISFFVLLFLYHAEPNLDNLEKLERSITTKSTRLKTARLPVNPHNYHVMMSNPRLCKSTKANLLILVASSAENVERRKAIRETWGNKKSMMNSNSRLSFMLANPNNKNIQKQIVEEYRTFGDIIQEDFVESYLNLTTKTIMGIKWASKHCSSASFVLKTDDDIYVNIAYLRQFLKSKVGEKLFIGCIKQKKTFLPAVNIKGIVPPRHPTFLAGAGYVFSGSIIKNLYESSMSIKSIPIEDVYVSAHLARSVGAYPPKHDSRFTCGEMLLEDCDMKNTFTGHKITPKRMYEIHRKLTAEKQFC